MTIRLTKRLSVFLAGCLFVMSLTACNKISIGFKDNQVLKVGDRYATTEQAAVLMCYLQKKYETMFGNEAWKNSFGDSTLDQYVKEQVKTQLVQLSSMTLLAEKKKLSLNDKETQRVARSVDEFMKGFSKKQLKKLNFQKSDVQELYTQYALASKVYETVTESVNAEISDDQARMIDVQVILFKMDKNDGVQEESGQEGQGSVMETAYQVWQRATSGETFESLASQYNEDAQMEYHLARGEMGNAFDEAAFQLSNGEISGLVEEKDGVYIIKCISNYNKEETDANKEAIYQKQCAEVFNKEYDRFMKDVNVKSNDEAWKKVSIFPNETLPDIDFVQIYKTADIE